MSAKYCNDPDTCEYSDCPTAFCDRENKSELAAMPGSAFLSPTEHGKYWHDLAQERIAEVARLRAELENIANAKPSEWGEMRDQFQAWAQNRARHALATPNDLDQRTGRADLR